MRWRGEAGNGLRRERYGSKGMGLSHPSIGGRAWVCMLVDWRQLPRLLAGHVGDPEVTGVGTAMSPNSTSARLAGSCLDRRHGEGEGANEPI